MRRVGDSNTRAPLVAVAVVSCIASGVAGTASWPAAQPVNRTVVVIGDLHMGPGRDRPRWHPFEDFRWRDELIAFLKSIDAEGAGATDLVLNGDTLELLQSPNIACAHGDPRLGCTEAEALARVEAVIAAHSEELEAIGGFARSGSNRVHVVPGDHDAALLFPSVHTRALRALGAPEDRIQIADSGGWLSSDGRVYVEHGHQLPMSADRFASWPKPFVSVRGRNHLEQPWGAQVIQPLYERFEPRYPSVDNVAEHGVGPKYVLATKGADPPEDIAALLRYFLTKTTWQQFRMDLDDGDVEAPVWDIAAIRRDPSAFLASSLPSDDPFTPLVARAAAAGQLRVLNDGITDAAIIAICDYRAAIRRARRRMERVLTQLPGVGPPIAECPRTAETVGPAFENYWRSRNLAFSQHIDATLERLKLENRATRPFDVFVYGHTHLADRPFRPGGEAGPIVATSGAWQRTIHPVQLEQLAKERGLPVSTLLLQLQPEDLPLGYSFVRFAPVAATRRPEMRVWPPPP